MSKFKPSQSVGALIHGSGTREETVLTFPATAAATQGDYISVYTPGGTQTAVWLDIDANGTAPTGALYVASDAQIEVDIVGGGTAAQNATLAYTALNGNVSGLSFVDNLDGTLTMTADDINDTTDATPKNADDSGAGSISVSATDGTSVSFPYEEPGDSPTARKVVPDLYS